MPECHNESPTPIRRMFLPVSMLTNRNSWQNETKSVWHWFYFILHHIRISSSYAEQNRFGHRFQLLTLTVFNMQQYTRTHFYYVENWCLLKRIVRIISVYSEIYVHLINVCCVRVWNSQRERMKHTATDNSSSINFYRKYGNTKRNWLRASSYTN